MYGWQHIPIPGPFFSQRVWVCLMGLLRLYLHWRCVSTVDAHLSSSVDMGPFVSEIERSEAWITLSPDFTCPKTRATNSHSALA